MSGTGHALALQGLTKRYGSFTAVADVSLRVERGDTSATAVKLP